LEFGNVDFWGEGKTEERGEKPLRARTSINNKLSPHMSPGPGIEVHSPLRYPCFPNLELLFTLNLLNLPLGKLLVTG